MNPETRESLIRLLRPLLFSFFLIAVGGWLFSLKIPTGEEASNAERMKALGYAFSGFLLIGAGAGILLFPLAHVISSYFESLFWPSDLGVAPALHKLPEWYLQEGRYADALAEYEKMIRNHPRMPEAYQGLLYVLYACMGDTVSADKRYRKGLRKISSRQREAFKAFYRELQENRAAAPNHSQKNPWEQ
jgi:tetratricopeptide (TPR) repeat protein